MLTPNRRHLKDCPHASKGRLYTLCECPIHVEGTLNGERIRRSLNTNNWERALRRINRLERGEDQDFMDVPAGLTVEAARARYIADAKARNLQPSSLRSIGRTLAQFCEAFGDLPVAELQADHFSQFRARREMKPRTQRKEIEYLRAFCAFCVAREWLKTNPAKAVKPPLVDDAPVLPYTRDEVDKLIAACDRMRGMWAEDTPEVRRRARALVLALIYSGLRVSDLVVLQRWRLEDSNHLVLRTMKNNVPVKVLLHKDAADALRSLPAPCGNPAYFFWSGNGDFEDGAKSLWRTIQRVGKVAGVHAHPHRFRHTFAVELLTNGATLREVQLLLGHKSYKTTEKHYAHFVPAHQEALDAAAATLDFRPKPARPLRVSPFHKRKRNA